MEGQETSQSPPPAISAVLDDDDLLGEIILRVAFPTSLVRVALVCKRWLSLASAPAFLGRFRDLHPPSLLGFYVLTINTNVPRFMPMPLAPELQAVVCMGSFYLGGLSRDMEVVECWNGLLLLSSPVHDMDQQRIRMVHRPLYPARNTTMLPPVPETSIDDGFSYYDHDIFPNGGDHALSSFFCLAVGYKQKQTIVHLYVLQGNIWAIHSSVVTEIPNIRLLFASLICDRKIYNLAYVDGTHKLFVLDHVSSSLSLVNLPQDVYYSKVELLLTHDSAIHLTLMNDDCQLSIWLYKMAGNGLHTWFLMDTIYLREICADHMTPTRVFKDVREPDLTVHAGVNSEFVFLESHGVPYLLDIKRKAAKKVYELTPYDKRLFGVTPFMMVWPPKFPAMK